VATDLLGGSGGACVAEVRPLARSASLVTVCGSSAATLIRIVKSEAHIHNNFRKYPRSCHLYIIGVLPEAQGKGLASTLMNPMLQRMKEKSIPVFLETANLRNVDIYKKKGFKIFETPTIRDHNVFLMSIES
jgi:ribosomal protein S18 acetylase RimI-like enzyme